MNRRFRWTRWLAAICLVLVAGSAWAQNVEIIDQRLDGDRHGYTVMRVWGSHYEMGYGMGHELAGDIMTLWDELMADYGPLYNMARSLTEMTRWLPAEIEDELQGMVEGVHAVIPDAGVDLTDMKMANIVASDLAYYRGCRSHSCWGRFVSAPVKTLSTRRLDFGTPFPSALHHVVCAWDPDDGSVRWVNVGWPGAVTVVTGVNAYGTQVSTHDYASASVTQDSVPRVVATRYVLTGMGDRPPSEHRTWAQGELTAMNVITGSFLNYFVPEGHGGVYTCVQGGPCGNLRVAQDDYHFGEVLITTNSQTDGHTTPGGGGFMNDYYEAGGPKDLQGHFDLMGLTGLHLVSVEYRGFEDMTILAHGRGRSDFIEVEWDDLFPPAVQPDGGPADAGGTDAGQSDAGGGDAGGGDSGTTTDDDQDAGSEPTDKNSPDDGETSGCGCGAGRTGPLAAGLLAFIGLALLARRRTREPRK